MAPLSAELTKVRLGPSEPLWATAMPSSCLLLGCHPRSLDLLLARHGEWLHPLLAGKFHTHETVRRVSVATPRRAVQKTVETMDGPIGWSTCIRVPPGKEVRFRAVGKNRSPSTRTTRRTMAGSPEPDAEAADEDSFSLDFGFMLDGVVALTTGVVEEWIPSSPPPLSLPLQMKMVCASLPISPLSGPTQGLFQEPPAKSKFLQSVIVDRALALACVQRGSR